MNVTSWKKMKDLNLSFNNIKNLRFKNGINE